MSEYTFAVGVIVGFHALKGEVKVRTSTNSPQLLLRIHSVKVEPEEASKTNAPLQILELESIRLNKNLLLVKFKGFSDRNSVEHLDGAKLFARECELLPLEQEEFWVRDLVGVDVYTTKGEFVGTVCSIISAATDVLEINPPAEKAGKTILVPFVQSLVPVVDMHKRRIEIVAIPGLLEPQ